MKSTLIAVAAAAAYAVAAQLAFNSGVVIAVAAPLVACGLGTAGMLAAPTSPPASDRRLLGWAVRRRTEQLRDAQFEVITRLAQAAESRDGDTGEHIHRIGFLCERLALQIGFDPARAYMLRHASALHDVGKIGIPDNVLLKPGPRPGRVADHAIAHGEGRRDPCGSASPLIQMAEAIARTHQSAGTAPATPMA